MSFGNFLRAASSALTLGIIPAKKFKSNGFLNLLSTGSINPNGTPVGRGDVPATPVALPPAAQLPNVPFQSAAGRRAGKRRRGNGTILTGSRGIQSQTPGKTLLGA